MTYLTPYRTNMTMRRPVAESSFMSDFFRPFFANSKWAENDFRVDIKDNGNEYLLEAELPGVKKEDLQIDVEDDVLTISASMNSDQREERDGYLLCERRSGSFRRSFSLENIREEDIRAEYTDGVLKLCMPKKSEQAARSRRIEIQ